jgi:hypothetical protein
VHLQDFCFFSSAKQQIAARLYNNRCPKKKVLQLMMTMELLGASLAQQIYTLYVTC